MIDAVACEPQFLDHLVPVWSVLRGRGKLRVASELMGHPAAFLLNAEPIDVGALKRRDPIPPKASPGDGPIAFVTSIGDVKVGRRLGYRRFVFMEHGAGQSYQGVISESYAGDRGREDVELFLCPNDYSASRFRMTYPKAAVEVVGCPRLDSLPARQISPIEPITVAISFHWPASVCRESDTALGTFFGQLKALAQRFHVIGHAHPKGDWPRRMERVYQRAVIEFVPTFDEVCRRADIYVCDNSSTLFEFAATGRPVVVLNGREYRKTVSHGGRFWDWATVGIQVDEPERLCDAVSEALIDPPEVRRERERVLDLVYQPRSGGARLAAAAIEAHIGEAVAA